MEGAPRTRAPRGRARSARASRRARGLDQAGALGGLRRDAYLYHPVSAAVPVCPSRILDTTRASTSIKLPPLELERHAAFQSPALGELARALPPERALQLAGRLGRRAGQRGGERHRGGLGALPAEHAAADAERLWHPYTSMVSPTPVLPVARARGAHLELEDGRRLVDGMSSWWAAVHGLQPPRAQRGRGRSARAAARTSCSAG